MSCGPSREVIAETSKPNPLLPAPEIHALNAFEPDTPGVATKLLTPEIPVRCKASWAGEAQPQRNGDFRPLCEG